jgi:hypothetical protein
MGVLYDYFRAPGVAEVHRHMGDNDGFSPVPATFDGIDLKNIDPSVTLGQLVGFATGREWSTDLVDERLIWPEGGEHDTAYQGPWVTVLDDRTRDVLAGIPADRMPELAERWATIEELDGLCDPELLHDVLADLAALAAQARGHGESLYCWMSL